MDTTRRCPSCTLDWKPQDFPFGKEFCRYCEAVRRFEPYFGPQIVERDSKSQYRLADEFLRRDRKSLGMTVQQYREATGTLRGFDVEEIMRRELPISAKVMENVRDLRAERELEAVEAEASGEPIPDTGAIFPYLNGERHSKRSPDLDEQQAAGYLPESSFDQDGSGPIDQGPLPCGVRPVFGGKYQSRVGREQRTLGVFLTAEAAHQKRIEAGAKCRMNCPLYPGNAGIVNK